MKLPSSFGGRLFFRAVLPGAVVAFYAVLVFDLDVLRAEDDALTSAAMFSLLTVAFGWGFVILDRPIYMLFEGRRYWPGPLWRWGVRRERARLCRLLRRMRAHDVSRSDFQGRGVTAEQARRIHLEAAVKASAFPLRAGLYVPTAPFPTRLGNAIAAFEQYPAVKYGLDAVFFWPRLWVAIDDPLRKELDESQAVGDGALYVAFAFILAAVLAPAAWLGGHLAPSLFPVPRPWPEIAGHAGLCFAVAFAACRLSLEPQQYYGELFKALFDQHRDRLKTQAVVEAIAAETQDLALLKGSEPLRNRAAWRFLRWHRVRPPGRSANVRARFP